MLSNQVLYAFVNGILQYASFFYSGLYLSFLLLFIILFLLVLSELGKCTEVINGIVKTCSLLFRIIFFWFREKLLAPDIDGPEFSLSYFLLFSFLIFLFIFVFFDLFGFLFDKLLNLPDLGLGSSQMMLRTFVGTLIGNLFILFFFFVFLDSLLYLCFVFSNFLLHLLSLRLILSSFKPVLVLLVLFLPELFQIVAFTEIRLMVPLILMEINRYFFLFLWRTIFLPLVKIVGLKDEQFLSYLLLHSLPL